MFLGQNKKQQQQNNNNNKKKQKKNTKPKNSYQNLIAKLLVWAGLDSVSACTAWGQSEQDTS